MEKIFLKYPGKIMKIKRKLEKALDIKISKIGEEIVIEGEGMQEFEALQVLEAIDVNFHTKVALLLRDPDYIFEKINLKDYVRQSRLSTIKSRIIGTKGNTKREMSILTDCEIIINDNTVYIIGLTDDANIASKAIRSLIKGSTHSSVYAFLEKARRIRKEHELLGDRASL
jgi:ribosomal RNA assembly protein